MKSIVQLNTFPRARHKSWQVRIDGVDAADDAGTQDLARHHFLIALAHRFDDIRFALDYQSELSKVSDREQRSGRRREAAQAADGAFQSFVIWDRLGPGIAAITKVAGGELPADLDEVRLRMWGILEDVDAVQENFYSMRAAQRRTVDLSEELRPLCDELEKLTLAFYEMARARYGLPEMKIWGRQ